MYPFVIENIAFSDDVFRFSYTKASSLPDVLRNIKSLQMFRKEFKTFCAKSKYWLLDKVNLPICNFAVWWTQLYKATIYYEIWLLRYVIGWIYIRDELSVWDELRVWDG